MSSAPRVPETATMPPSDLRAESPGDLVARVSRRRLITAGWSRLHRGDGFASARALGLQLVMAVVPLTIAIVGLSRAFAGQVGEVFQETLLRLSPGTSDDVIKRTLDQQHSGGAHGFWLPLVGGLVAGLVSLTVAMTQTEKGMNRIYGLQADRPWQQSYPRAALLALTAGLPGLLGVMVMLMGPVVGDTLARRQALSHPWQIVVDIACYLIGAALAWLSFTRLLTQAPARQQPGREWTAIGATAALVIWLVVTLLLGLYVRLSSSFGQTYGPLTAVIALLIWANLSSVAIFGGTSLAAELEAARVTRSAGDREESNESSEQTATRRDAAGQPGTPHEDSAQSRRHAS